MKIMHCSSSIYVIYTGLYTLFSQIDSMCIHLRVNLKRVKKHIYEFNKKKNLLFNYK